MTDRYPPITRLPHLLHGGDYYPEQWTADVWDEDMRLMKLAGCNAMSIGIFSWVHLEPQEGRYSFDWLDRIMDLLSANGMYAVLGTPSAAHPAWLSARYPEVLRTGEDRRRRRHGARVNFCPTSPVYRRKVAEINERLAERYRDHPALLLWHVSNEYSGECHCELCQEAFRDWLRARYGTLEALNAAHWNAFWGHTYTDWSQLESPASTWGVGGDATNEGLRLDWRRFVTDRVVDFMLNEMAPLRRHTPDVPVTANFMTMSLYPGLNFWKLAPHLDVVSWDCYPSYHDRRDDWDWKHAAEMSFAHDIHRAMKAGRPWLLMESTPSSANWMRVMKLKRPGVHRLGSLQAVAHGSDSVQYFQWRKGRGGHEKFHGAVVDHCGHAETRVFRDVAEMGQVLRKLDGVIGTTVRPEVALVYDWENRWAIDLAGGPRREGRHYAETCFAHYRPFWSRGVPVDVIDMDCDLAPYKLLVAPMLHMVRAGAAERIEQFVAGGGTFVTTYWSGVVNESGLCHLGGWPGPDALRRTLGIWAEELDVLYDDESNRIVAVAGNDLHLTGEYEARVFCDLIHAEGAEVLATYAREFYAGRPALTVNRHGSGRAYYVASRNDERFQDDFFGALIGRLGLRRALAADLPPGVTAQVRGDGRREYVFVLNFTRNACQIDIGGEKLTDVLTGQPVPAKLALAPHDSRVLLRE